MASRAVEEISYWPSKNRPYGDLCELTFHSVGGYEPLRTCCMSHQESMMLAAMKCVMRSTSDSAFDIALRTW